MRHLSYWQNYKAAEAKEEWGAKWRPLRKASRNWQQRAFGPGDFLFVFTLEPCLCWHASAQSQSADVAMAKVCEATERLISLLSLRHRRNLLDQIHTYNVHYVGNHFGKCNHAEVPAAGQQLQMYTKIFFIFIPGDSIKRPYLIWSYCHLDFFLCSSWHFIVAILAPHFNPVWMAMSEDEGEPSTKW